MTAVSQLYSVSDASVCFVAIVVKLTMKSVEARIKMIAMLTPFFSNI